LTTLDVDAVQESTDGTRKYRMRTQDGKFIESVYMPDEAGPESFDPEADEEEGPRARVRRTLCVSTQVGCAMGCGFCMTATMGLPRQSTGRRDLRPGLSHQCRPAPHRRAWRAAAHESGLHGDGRAAA